MFHIPQDEQAVDSAGQLKVNCEPSRRIEQLAAKA